MKQKFFLVLLVIAALVMNFMGIYLQDFWLENLGQVLFILPMAMYYLKKLPSRNLNFYLLIICLLCTSFLTFFSGIWYINQLILGFWLIAYIFLSREAIKHTEYEKGSRFTIFYFFIVVAVYAYLLSLHILEIERMVTDNFVLSLYIIYYLNLLFFAAAALVYYLNSFSRKAVFFICFTLAFIFADVLRDMEVFYFRDLSIEIVESLIRFAAIMLIFLFFNTKEKKLRLLHLV